MTRQFRCPTAIAAVAMAAVLWTAPTAWADQWNEKTELTFTEPVIIPGATLEPGTYIFKLADLRGARHTIEVIDKDTNEMVALTMAVPIRRVEPREDVILKFNPTDAGMPAIKGWFYPGAVTGHEFVYSDEQAKQIAERAKTVVLSIDVPDSDLEKGTLRVYDPAAGAHREWRADAETERAWNEWQRNRAVVRTSQDAGDEDEDNGSGDRPDASAPMMAGAGTGERVEFDAIEDNPQQYVGRTISVDAEVDEVFGPRLFNIEAPYWDPFGDDVLVYAPSMLAALVKDDDRVTVTGELKTVTVAELEKEFGWFGLNPHVEAEFRTRPVLVAQSIRGGDNNIAMYIGLEGTAPRAEGNAGMVRSGSPETTLSAANRTVMDLALIGSGTTDLVGRQVDVKNARVLRPAKDGFFVDAPGAAVFVHLPPTVTVTVAPGDEVTLRGAIADAPRDIDQRINPPAGWNPHIYIVASDVSKS